MDAEQPRNNVVQNKTRPASWGLCQIARCYGYLLLCNKSLQTQWLKTTFIMPITSVGQGLGQGTARVACHCFTLTPLGGLKCLHHLCVWYMDWHPWLGSPGLWAKVPTRSLSLYSDLLTAWWSQGGQTSYMATQGSKRESPSEQDRSCMAFYDLASKIDLQFAKLMSDV